MKISYKHENFVSIYVIIFQIWTFCFGYTFLQDTLQLITLKIWLNFGSTIFLLLLLLVFFFFFFFAILSERKVILVDYCKI